jgi:hypothetical protein
MQPEIHLFASLPKVCVLEEHGIFACKLDAFSQHCVADFIYYQLFSIVTQTHG